MVRKLQNLKHGYSISNATKEQFMKSIILESILEYRLSYEVGYYLENCSVPMRIILSFLDSVKCFVELSVSAVKYKLNPHIYDKFF